MSDSALGLGREVAQRSSGAAEPGVEVDAGGQGEQALGDSGAEVAQRAGAVAFEAEEFFAGPEDRFDPLADRSELRSGVGLVFAGGAQQRPAELGDRFSEVATGVALVANDELAAAQRGRQ